MRRKIEVGNTTQDARLCSSCGVRRAVWFLDVISEADIETHFYCGEYGVKEGSLHVLYHLAAAGAGVVIYSAYNLKHRVRLRERARVRLAGQIEKGKRGK